MEQVNYVSTPRSYKKWHKIQQQNAHKILTCNDSYLEIKKNKTADGSTCNMFLKQVCIMHQMADIATGLFAPGGRLAPGYSRQYEFV